MRAARLSALLALFLMMPLAAKAEEAPSSVAALEGEWRVDLRPAPDADPSFQTFAVKKVRERTFSGTFYGTKFKKGRINDAWGTLYFAFTTEDRRTEYHHSGRLVDGRLEGLTHAPGRDFLSVWTAERVRPAP